MKMKSLVILLCVFLVFLSATPVFAQYTAKYTTSRVLIDGEDVAFEAYNIDDNNYFKLRDVAKALSGTSKQFEVTWDKEAGAINLISGKSYTSVGGELLKGDGTKKTATKSDAQILLDGKLLKTGTLNAYNINGNNYFKLRDLGALFGFEIIWDGSKNRITIDTSGTYEDDSISISAIKDNKKAIYTLTTDDGYAYTADFLDKVLKENDMVATMGLVTDWVGNAGMMTWTQAQDLVKTGRWGVANHTKAHKQDDFLKLTEDELEKEINGARTVLLQKFPSLKILGLYTPGGQTNPLIVDKVKENHLILRRASGGNNSLPITALEMLALKTQSIFSSTTLEAMQNWIDSGIQNGEWIVEMWHGVGENDAKSWGGNISEENAKKHIEYVAKKMQEGKLWVTTLDEAAVYITQYNDAKITTISNSGDELEFSLTDTLDDKIFDAELTVNIKIPMGYKNATVIQGGKEIETSVSNGILTLNIKPDGDNIKVKFN